ncbi:protein kinase domain-containing protein [Nocardiopsis halotolerans]|uniref:protein kinase domain-containing protein n=1 Tax=Nocardiopsis halotolerans TaxID=124252 RepID=UPI00034C3065|nr:protein kinase family protein [Nocardiopsis halotolerans]
MSENGSRDGVYTTPHREEVPCRLLRVGPVAPDVPSHPLLEYDLVRDEISGRELLRVRVDASGRERPRERVRAFAALDNEILAGVRVARIANGSPPPELGGLVGYHDDPTEPFALLEPYRGESMDLLARRRQLFDEEQHAFREGLLRALSWLRSCEVVHRDIRPRTVRWDTARRSVQLCGFAHATVAGTPRTAVGTEPWTSHEQRKGTGVCDPRDDLWSAGLVLFQVLSGHDVESGGLLPVEDFPGLAVELKGVFARTARDRPDVDELLSRFSGGAVPYRRGIDTRLRPGHARFEESRDRKRIAAGFSPSEPAEAPSTPLREEEPAPAGSGAPRTGGDVRPPEARRPDHLGKLALLLLVLVGAAVTLFAYFG